MDLTKTYKRETNFKIDPTQFTLWIFLVSVCMLFAAFTSGYIVRKAEGNWIEFSVPAAFLLSTIYVIASSVPMILAQIGHRRGNKTIVQMGLLGTLILGVLFVWQQLIGYEALMDQGVFLVGNPSGSFFYVITGVHGAHVGVGILIVLFALVRSLFISKNDVKVQKITSVATYWHFVGVLWLYLYLFLSNV